MVNQINSQPDIVYYGGVKIKTSDIEKVESSYLQFPDPNKNMTEYKITFKNECIFITCDEDEAFQRNIGNNANIELGPMGQLVANNLYRGSISGVVDKKDRISLFRCDSSYVFCENSRGPEDNDLIIVNRSTNISVSANRGDKVNGEKITESIFYEVINK